MTLTQIESRIKLLKLKEADFLMWDAQEELDRCRQELSDLNCLAAATIESDAVVEDIERLAAESEEDAEYVRMVEQAQELEYFLDHDDEW